MTQVTIDSLPLNLSQQKYTNIYQFFAAAVESGDIVEFREVSREEIPDHVYEKYLTSEKDKTARFVNL